MMTIREGDFVLVKSKEWYDENKNSSGAVDVPHTFVPGMAKYCGQILKVTSAWDNTYYLENADFMWSRQMFEKSFDGQDPFIEETIQRFLSSRTDDLSISSSKYPTTYRKCCNILGVVPNRYDDLLSSFVCLRTVRDAFWKVTKEQPDWTNPKQKKFIIVNVKGVITKKTTESDYAYFAFTDEEAADTICKYFEPLLSVCKELL